MKKYIIAIVTLFAINCVWAKPGDITNNLIDNRLFIYFESYFKSVVDANKNETEELGRLFIKMVAGAKNEGTQQQAKYLAQLSTSSKFINRKVKGGQWDGYNGLQLCFFNNDLDTAQILIKAGCDPYYKHPRTGKSFSMMLRETNNIMSQHFKEIQRKGQQFMSDPSNTGNEEDNSIINATINLASSFADTLNSNNEACRLAEEIYKFKPNFKDI